MSSIAATGPSRDGNLLDETSELKPITNYGVSKVEVEKLCKYYYDNFNVPVVTIRPPMVYGVYDKDWINFFSLIKYYVINDKKLPMPGDHTNLFDFCYVGNLVHGLIQAEKSDKTCGKIYFLTDNKTYTIKELLTAISNELHIKYPTKLCNKNILYLKAFLLELGGKMQKKDPFISRKEFNYNPSITLEEGIKRTIEWGKNNKII
jgi:nucleoside-diphosphate-sugar epimerase